MSDAAALACALCGHTPLHPFAMAAAGPDALHVAQWECPSCRLLTSHPQASADRLESYYSGDYYGRIWNDPEHVWRQNLVAYRTELDLIDAFVPAGRKGRALDVGCGYGVMLHLLRQRGYDAIGCEMGVRALSYCHSQGLHVARAIAPELPFRDAAFRLVISFHVIEHVPDPAAFVRSLVRAVEPGGTVIIVTDHRWTTHYGYQRLLSRLRGRVPPFCTSTDHTFVFAPEHVASLLTAAGCVDVKSAAFTHVPPVESLHWRVYKGVFRMLDRLRGWGDYMMIVGHKPAVAREELAA